jgi:zinc protease
MTKSLRTILAGLLLTGSTMAAQSPDYLVVVSTATLEAPGWKAVVEALEAKRPTQRVDYDGTVAEAALPALRRWHPRYVCFVARPEEVSREFVATVHGLTRRADADPYTDCFWGILTGYDAANALAIAKTEPPLTVRKVSSGTEVALDRCEQGEWYCELQQNRHVRKQPGGKAQELNGPDDTTAALVESLNGFQPDLFVTSGHATERDWQIGFTYRNGTFRHEDGRLFGRDAGGTRFPIDSPNPKVYLPIGNCLMGHIDRPDCMATSWMNSAGVRQMIGYIVPTWYGYAGWGMLDYFVEQPGRYTFAEAFVANDHALIHRLRTYFPDLVGTELPPGGRPQLRIETTDAAKAAGLSAQDGYGLLFDRDVVAFYGDPAWGARMAEGALNYGQELSETDGVFTFEITPLRGKKSFAPVNTNGVQRGGRPFVAFLPNRMKNIRIIEGADLNPVITDDFILVPNAGPTDSTTPLRVRFRAEPIH